MTMLTLMLCCRDEHGNFLHSAEAARIEHPDGSHASLEGAPIVVRSAHTAREPSGEGYFRFGRKHIYARTWSVCVGNVHWDRVTLSETYVSVVLAYAHHRGWLLTDGPCDGPLAAMLADAGWTP